MVYIKHIIIINYNLLKDGDVVNSNNKVVGDIGFNNNGHLISMEADLRSVEEEKKRTLKYFVNGIQQSFYFTNLPSEVVFAVCYYIIKHYIVKYYIVLYGSFL